MPGAVPTAMVVATPWIMCCRRAGVELIHGKTASPAVCGATPAKLIVCWTNSAGLCHLSLDRRVVVLLDDCGRPMTPILLGDPGLLSLPRALKPEGKSVIDSETRYITQSAHFHPDG